MARSSVKGKVLPEKDEEEIHLEKLVFGDQASFQNELQQFEQNLDQQQAHEEWQHDFQLKPTHSADQRDLALLDDSELFFFDAGSGGDAAQIQVSTLSGDVEGAAEAEDPPAWVDSDDERVMISLSSNNQLRKLRRSEAEDLISGTEYTRRLCEQFERLYPVPAWAAALRQHGSGAHRKKRRRLSASSSSSDQSVGEENEVEPDDLSTQPLAQLLQNTVPLVSRAARKINGRVVFKPEVLDIQRTRDVAASNPSSVLSLSFHPSLPLLLSSGPSGLLTLHHIAPAAPTPNPTLTKIAIRKLPIQTSAFHPSGTRVFLAAPRRYYHVWDLESGRFHRVAGAARNDASLRSCEQFIPSPCGRYVAFVGSGRKGGGVVNVVNADTGQWVCSGRVEGRGGVADIAWWRSGDGLCILGKGGEVLEYSVREQRPLARWTDEGAVGATVIALSGPVAGSKRATSLGGDRFVAIGSSSGIVNIYDRSQWGQSSADESGERSELTIPSTPQPRQTFDQLVTSISCLRFSPDGQLLAMGSQQKKDALRLIHLPSCTVYRNWPTSDTPLGRVTSLAWSQINEQGALVLAIANEQGRIRLWQVRG